MKEAVVVERPQEGWIQLFFVVGLGYSLLARGILSAPVPEGVFMGTTRALRNCGQVCQL
jgi:hypothetical protein